MMGPKKWFINIILYASIKIVTSTEPKHSCNVSESTNIFSLFRPFTPRKCCNCDDDCLKYGDCCLDKYSDEYSGTNYIEYFLNRTKIKNFFRYINVINKRVSPTIELRKRYMIAKCDKNSSEFQQKCNFVYDDNDYPVYDEQGLLYRNYHCAKCHNSSVVYRNVNLTIKCQSEYLKDNSTNFSIKGMGCILDIELSTQYTLSFFNPSKREFLLQSSKRISCSENHLLLCHGYMAIVKDQRGKTYPNKYCAFCYNNYRKDLTERLCRDEYIVYSEMLYSGKGMIKMNNYINYSRTGMTEKQGEMGPTIGPFQFSFSLMMSQSANGMVTDEQFCKPGSVFNLLRGECAAAECSYGYIRRENSCIKPQRLDSFKSNVSSKVNFELEERKRNCIKANTKYVKVKVSKRFNAMQYPNLLSNGSTSFNESIDTKSYILLNTNNHSEFLKNVEDLGKDGEIIEIIYYLSDYSPHDTIHDGDIIQKMIDGKLCVSPTTYNEFNISEKCNPVINGSEYPLMKNASIWMVKKDSSVSFFITTCSSFHLHSNCSKGFYRKHKYQIDPKTKVVMIGKKEFKPDQYHPTVNGIEICLSSDRYFYPLEGTIYYVENIISVSFLVLSLLSELITMTVYGITQDLQNTPGMIIMCIALTALINDILVTYMAFAVLTEDVCSILAIILHWFSLALSMWSLCFSYDLWKTLKNSFQRRKSGKKNFMLYLITVIVVASAILALAFLFQSLINFDVSYGKASEGLCWIRSKHARIVFYIIPTFIMLALSAVLLIGVIFQMKRNSISTMRASGHGSRKSKSLNLKVMAMKMIFALGIVELLPLIEIKSMNRASAIANQIVSFLNNVFRSLRGTSLMIIFVFSKAAREKVWKQIIKKDKKRQDKDDQKSVQTNTKPSKTTNNLCLSESDSRL